MTAVPQSWNLGPLRRLTPLGRVGMERVLVSLISFLFYSIDTSPFCVVIVVPPAVLMEMWQGSLLESRLSSPVIWLLVAVSSC